MHSPLAIFILQLIVIIIAARAFAFIFQKIGQPAVMGEIIAGIALGPSLLGAMLPEFSAALFPATSFGNLQMLSQVGLILFMFVIGMELDLNIIKQKAKAAVFISYASIIIPFALGASLAYFMYAKFAPANIPFYAFALFMGIAMSITAFPVLARIIRERNIGNTRFGVISMASAAIDDVTGWCLLALVVAIVNSKGLETSLYTFLEAIAYVCVMLFAVRPLLKRLSKNAAENKVIRQSTVAIIFVVLLLSAYCCEVIGIHALFGAFMAGIIMPLEWNFRHIIINKIEDVSMVLFLPIFFVLTGLRTEMGLLNDISLWGICLIIIALAVIGKLGGSSLAAKLSGESTYESLSIGALMNTRGLMELIILNIGYDLGILTPQVFTMMVIMALVTTLMTNPILNLLDRIYKK
jgi:Kef-type K+ transport system membrane component KefB